MVDLQHLGEKNEKREYTAAQDSRETALSFPPKDDRGPGCYVHTVYRCIHTEVGYLG